MDLSADSRFCIPASNRDALPVAKRSGGEAEFVRYLYVILMEIFLFHCNLLMRITCNIMLIFWIFCFRDYQYSPWCLLLSFYLFYRRYLHHISVQT